LSTTAEWRKGAALPAEILAGLGGIALGFIGTLVGAGGGFLLVPALALLEPRWSTEIVTAFSLAVVAANATTGATSYWLQGRVDVRSFLMFAAAAVPGSIGGVFATTLIPRRVFDPLFGVVLLGIAVWLFVRRAPGADTPAATGRTSRRLVDRAGNEYAWSYEPLTGIAGSAFVGFLSSLLGIGGGIVHVPLLVTLLNFPEHIATATSHAVLAVTSAIGTAVHLAHGDYRDDWRLVVTCSVGAVIGAPFGARASLYASGSTILRVLALALAIVAIRLLVAR